MASAKFLKNLELGRRLLPKNGDDSYLKSLEDAISNNTCLERLYVKHIIQNMHETEERAVERYRRYNTKLSVPLSVNRAARRLDHSALLGLWPHVLERAGKILYYSVNSRQPFYRVLGDDWKNPTSERPRIDVVYKLLRERVLAT